MKKSIFFFLLICCSLFCFSQTKTYQLSSHILDNSTGEPAPSVSVTLEKMNVDNSWTKVSTQITDKEGRIGNFLPYDQNNDGVYKLVFHIQSYFDSKKLQTFYPFIEIVFRIKGNKHFHVPLTVSPYGYSTYKGS
ncbi:hydroxyisourate hydrolase [Empedobacter brevis]|uniref:hydroxyisourate hydrolase n=1 Tax=Empedobacter sp. R750 TaxID=2746741 RepID=UPI00257799BE|nr:MULTISPECIES: hydroxyisourate hydrolase [Empedobacter]MDM1043080.1 hydroxyisourate hydrolase [Empedobacter brevis]MDM1137002.1 hydroxyisourate hydrolase [Empedobacter sp. R750]